MRSPSSLLSNLLIPSTLVRPANQRPLPSIYSHRIFSTTGRRLSQAAAPVKPPPSEEHPSEASDADASSKAINSLLGFRAGSQTNSLDEANQAYRNRGSLFGSQFSTPRNRSNSTQPNGLNVSRMKMPASPSFAAPTTPPPAIRSPTQTIRLNASTGRSVELDPNKGRDLVRGLSQLNSLIARNRVRADFQTQRFHERPGLKRKRLKSQRWRKRFKAGFKEVVGRVAALTKKGW